MPTIHHLCSQWLILLMEVAQSLTWIYFSVSSSVMAVVRFYSNEAVKGRSLQQAAKLCPELLITTELCYNVELTGETPRDAQMQMTYALILWSLQGFRLYFLHSFLPSVFFFLLTAAGCESLSAEQKEVLLWLFRPPLQAEPLSEKPNLTEASGEKLVEIGPRYDCTLEVW